MSYLLETNPERQAPMVPKSSILIVEDEFITFNTLQLMLQKSGYRVCGHAFSVAEALTIMETQKPDMVLLDIYLQGDQTGIDLAKILDQQHIPFVYISAYANAGLIEDAKATRPYGYLVKPFREQDVLVTLEIAYYRHQNNRELALQKEQNLLLRLGQVNAGLLTKESLFRALQTELTAVLPVEDLVLLLWDTETKTTNSLQWNKDLPVYREQMNEAINAGTPSYLKWLEKRNEPFLFQASDGAHLFPEVLNHYNFKAKSSGEYVVVPLQKSGILLGSLTLYNTKAGTLHHWRKQLYQGISDQVSNSIVNLLAQEEKIKQKKEEILQKRLVDTLSEASDWEHKLLKVAKAIQEHIPFDFIVLGVNQEKTTNPHCAFFRVGFEEYQVIQVIDLLQMLGITSEYYGTLLREMGDQQPAIWEGEAFADICRRYRLKALIAKRFNMEANLTAPLPITPGGVFAISLYSRKPQVYKPEHLALLERLKPSLVLTVDRLLALGELELLSQQFGRGLKPLPEFEDKESRFEGIIGQSTTLKQVFELTAQVAPVSTTVLLLGESGTGKELFAKAIHQLSPRKDKPLIKVNCATMPANLIESELFGHEKGAFTGAIEKRIGKFELANGGTIFLDEIGEMPLDLQVKLLRVLQEREIERIGGKSSIKIDVRIIAATNRHLKTEVDEGRFRLDLYYRLNVFPLSLPPLRDRKNDIPLLAGYFAQRFSKVMGKQHAGFSQNALAQLSDYSWPGNIRELENVVERMVIMNNGNSLLECENLLETDQRHPEQLNDAITPAKPKSLMDTEREYIYSILQQTGWRIRGKNGAAEMLNIKPTTLEYRMEKLGIKKPRYNGE